MTLVLLLSVLPARALAARGVTVTPGEGAGFDVQAGELKVDLLTGEAWTTPYTAGPGTLSVVVDRQPVVLVRRR